ncbi:hypothetical protein MIND_01333400 [Mycena indigotica]|uniref:Uncharacterized protein n=1 Tax=Mycena indigotica TaxID=2126181 RepID=A0A8H6S2P2_9AGAR|nr:uncharacterized protein MIND_01333400 [Mycena indigotica]KAF7290200.1 hypothetical protein MIND_01333400 [Mycena indigotica]
MAPSRLSLLVLLAAGSIASSLAETEWYTRNRNTIESIYNLTVYPHNLAVLNGSIPPGLFDDNANGRITPVGEFFGFQDSVEYFWGLAPVPSGHPPNAVFASADVVHFVSGCPEVAASTVYFTYKTLNPDNTPGAFVTKLKQVAFWHFDAAGAVLAYDAWIPNIQKTVGHTQPGGATPAGRNATISTLCTAQATTCVGDNEVYADADECVHILGQRDFGDWDDVWGDNVVCRLIHARLAILRPEVHCVHVGPTGGGKCVDVEYNDVYYNDELVFGEHGAATFDCGTYRD